MPTQGKETIFSFLRSDTTLTEVVEHRSRTGFISNERSNFYRNYYWGFYVGAVLRRRLRGHGERSERGMNLESILATACSVLLLIYLVYALLRPEKF